MYTVSFPDKEGGYVVATSLRRLVEVSKDKGHFVFPLHLNPVLQRRRYSIEADTLRKWRSFVEKNKVDQNTDHSRNKKPELLKLVEQIRLATSNPEEKDQCEFEETNVDPEEEKENEPGDEKENEDQHFFNISRITAKGLLSEKEKGTWILYFNKHREE